MAAQKAPVVTEPRMVVWNLRNYREEAPLSALPGTPMAELVAQAAAQPPPQARPGTNPPKPKDPAEVDKLIDALVRLRPTIAVFSEVGPAPHFASLQQRLALAGLPLPHAEFVQGPDTDRHLAVLTAHPISERFSAPWCEIAPAGTARYVSRGFLGVTLEPTPGTRLGVIAVHLKSAREEDVAPDIIRREEALALRKLVVERAAVAEDLPIFVVGDLNDDRASPTLRQVMGFMDAAEPRLTALALEDALGDRWTHFWEEEDAYTRIDYILANPAAKALLKPKAYYIERHPPVGEVSDHRPLVLDLQFP